MSQAFLEQVDELIRARYTLLHVVTFEEERARRLLAQIAQKQQKALFEWSVTDGLRRVVDTADSRPPENTSRLRDALAVLN